MEIRHLKRLLVSIILVFGLGFSTVLEPVAAGSFYPENWHQLERMLSGFFRKIPRTVYKQGPFWGGIVPHAGYTYSGQIAAFTYLALSRQGVETVILVGPSHRTQNDRIAVWSKGKISTALGDLPVNEELAQELIDFDERIASVESVFLTEHSLDVQFPFLAYRLPRVKVVPILLEKPTWQNIQILSDALQPHLDDKTVLLISTDFSHYHTHDEAKEMDLKTFSMIRNGEPGALADAFASGVCEACGYGGILLIAHLQKAMGMENPQLLKEANSGDITGEMDRVVGYASFVYPYKKKLKEDRMKISAETYSREEKQDLLKLARDTLEAAFDKRSLKPPPVDDHLKAVRGVFVTLHRQEKLRGCIGNIVGVYPLIDGVQKMAIQAAFHDPRFPALTREELAEINIEISVLTPLKEIKPEDVEVGRHGLVIKQGYRQGVLLPQVPVEWGWDREEYLENLCYKAGLPGDAWKTADLMSFEAIVFSEAAR